jgi:hypothetical protein
MYFRSLRAKSTTDLKMPSAVAFRPASDQPHLCLWNVGSGSIYLAVLDSRQYAYHRRAELRNGREEENFSGGGQTRGGLDANDHSVCMKCRAGSAAITPTVHTSAIRARQETYLLPFYR